MISIELSIFDIGLIILIVINYYNINKHFKEHIKNETQ